MDETTVDTTGTTTPTTALDPSQSTLSPSFAPYVNTMLSMGAGAAQLPYQEYTGTRYAGPSALQQQAFQGIAGLGVPSQFGTATQMATQAGNALSNLGYSPTQFGNQFTAPGAYQTGQFDTQLGPLKSVQDYMSQYTTGVSDIAAREATRQADISRQAEQARLAQAGGYGGSRQAIMEAERQRNLGTQISDIRTQGLQAAFDRAQKQRLEEAGMGMDAQKAQELSRQFGAQQGMTGAQSAAQYGLAGQQAEEQSRQFGANYGLQGLQSQLQAAQALGGLGAQQQAAQQGLANLQLSAGATQQQLAQQPLDFGYQQFQESMKYPYQQATFMQSLLQGLPLKATEYQPEGSALSGAMSGGAFALALQKYLDSLGG